MTDQRYSIITTDTEIGIIFVDCTRSIGAISDTHSLRKPDDIAKFVKVVKSKLNRHFGDGNVCISKQMIKDIIDETKQVVFCEPVIKKPRVPVKVSPGVKLTRKELHRTCSGLRGFLKNRGYQAERHPYEIPESYKQKVSEQFTNVVYGELGVDDTVYIHKKEGLTEVVFVGRRR